MTVTPSVARSARGAVHNSDLATAFNEIADILEIEGANPFRVRAYRNAARVLGGLPTEVSVMLARGEDLSELPGIGKDLAQKIADLAATGTTPLLGKLHRELPPAITELLRLPGLGPRRVKMLHDRLGVETLPQLHRALKDGRVRGLPGFGEHLTQRLLQAVAAKAAGPGRTKLAVAAQYAEPLLAYLQALPGARKMAIAGSYRRAHGRRWAISTSLSRRRSPPPSSTALRAIPRPPASTHRGRPAARSRCAQVCRSTSASCRPSPALDHSLANDTLIRNRVLAEIDRQAWALRALVEIAVTDSVVHLRGIVLDEKDRQALRVLAENVPGVEGVEDHLEYVPPIPAIAV